MGSEQQLEALQRKMRQLRELSVHWLEREPAAGDDTYSVGRSLLADGLRFGALLRDAEAALPFVDKGADFLRAARRGGSEDAGASDAFTRTYRRFKLHAGLFVAAGLAGRVDREGLAVAGSTLSNLFSPSLVERYAGEIESGAQDLEEVGRLVVVYLAVCVLDRLPDDGGRPSWFAERALDLPVAPRLRDLHERLAGWLAPAAGEAEREAYDAAYDALFDWRHYELGVVSGFLIEDAYLLSLVRRRGAFLPAMTDMLFPATAS